MGHHSGQRGETGNPEDAASGTEPTDQRAAGDDESAPPSADRAPGRRSDAVVGRDDGAPPEEAAAADALPGGAAEGDSPRTVSLGTVEEPSPPTVTLGPDRRHDLPSPRTVDLGPAVAVAEDRAPDRAAAAEPESADAESGAEPDAAGPAAAPGHDPASGDERPGERDRGRAPVADADAERSAELGLSYGEELSDETTGGDYYEDRAEFVPVPPVELLARRYRLGELLGRGGMGTVWRATDERLGRQVAVKELRLSSVIDDAERRRLITRTLREARAIATIRGRGVVTVFDVVDEGDRPWIVMELIEGRSLADVIREDGPLTPRRAAEVGLAVVDVLAAAHRAGIVHRDVKPSNVLVSDADGRVVLTDFGIAKVEGDPSITSTGMLVGAPSYISPERACGEDFGPPADYWSLGALLYCALVGRPPYDRGGAISTLTAVMNDPVVVPDAAGPLAEVITGLLDKDPAERFDEAVTRAMLRQVLDRSRRAATGVGTSVPVPRTPRQDAPDPAAQGRDQVGATATSAAADSGDLPATAAAGTAVARSGEAPAEPATASPARPADPRAAGRSGRGAPEAAAPRDPADRERDKAAATALGADSGRPDAPGSRRGASGGGAGDGAAPAGGGGRRRVLILLAIVVAVAMLSGVLATRLLGDGSDDTPDPAPTETTDEGTDAGADGGAGEDDDAADGGSEDPSEDANGGQAPEGDTAPEGDGSDQDPDPEESGPPRNSPERDTDAPFPPEGPTGFARTVDLQYRFSMAMPGDWEQTGTAGRNSGAIYSHPSGPPPAVQVDFTTSPGSDAEQAWLELEPSVRDASTDYERVRIDSVEWRDYPTVSDWEFERTMAGTRVRVLNRGFRVDDGRGYAVMVTCVAEEWDGNDCRTLRDTAFRTFEPLG